MSRLSGRSAIVTGGGGEIGRATAIRLAAEGARVAVVDLDQLAADETARLIRATGGEALSRAVDVARKDEVEAMAAAVHERYGRIDLLCNIAGIAPPAPLLETTDENWDLTIDVNLKGVFLCTRAVARLMVADRNPGTIVNMASTNGLVGEIGLVAYNASKFGVVGLTMTAAMRTLFTCA